jgi:hypothetical protein
MHANVEVHAAINRANAASVRIASTLNVDDVQASMSQARDHMDDHQVISSLPRVCCLFDTHRMSHENLLERLSLTPLTKTRWRAT